MIHAVTPIMTITMTNCFSLLADFTVGSSWALLPHFTTF
jgi:hypothetical protein